MPAAHSSVTLSYCAGNTSSYQTDTRQYSGANGLRGNVSVVRLVDIPVGLYPPLLPMALTIGSAALICMRWR